MKQYIVRAWVVYLFLGLGLLGYWIGLACYAIGAEPVVKPVPEIYGSSPTQVYKTPLESFPQGNPCR